MADAARIEVTGLTEMLKGLRGAAFKEFNHDMRRNSRLIAQEILLPAAVEAVAKGAAPQSEAMSRTIRVHSDRVPVVVVGKTNPKFRSHKFAHKGESGPSRKRRRGSMARGVIAGPAGGRRSTVVDENYYRIPRDDSWGALGEAINGDMMREVADVWRDMFLHVMRAHGFAVRS